MRATCAAWNWKTNTFHFRVEFIFSTFYTTCRASLYDCCCWFFFIDEKSNRARLCASIFSVYRIEWLLYWDFGMQMQRYILRSVRWKDVFGYNMTDIRFLYWSRKKIVSPSILTSCCIVISKFKLLKGFGKFWVATKWAATWANGGNRTHTNIVNCRIVSWKVK